MPNKINNNITVVSSEKFRSQKYKLVNSSYDMVRVTVDMPIYVWNKTQTYLKELTEEKENINVFNAIMNAIHNHKLITKGEDLPAVELSINQYQSLCSETANIMFKNYETGEIGGIESIRRIGNTLINIHYPNGIQINSEQK